MLLYGVDKMEEMVKTKYRDDEEKKKLITRLKTIEGQVRGVSGMISKDAYCVDVLTQLLAINKSIKSLSSEVLKGHLNTCVVDNIKNDNLDVIDEVMDLIRRLG